MLDDRPFYYKFIHVLHTIDSTSIHFNITYYASIHGKLYSYEMKKRKLTESDWTQHYLHEQLRRVSRSASTRPTSAVE